MNYFSHKEHECGCGCGGKWKPEFLALMNYIRGEAGVPMHITSGMRCEAYDKSIGGRGPHRTGKAADVACSGLNAHAILKAAMKAGATGIGISQKGEHSRRFIHIDMTDGPTRPWVWGY